MLFRHTNNINQTTNDTKFKKLNETVTSYFIQSATKLYTNILYKKILVGKMKKRNRNKDSNKYKGYTFLGLPTGSLQNNNLLIRSDTN